MIGFDGIAATLAAALRETAPPLRPDPAGTPASTGLSVAYQVMVELGTGRVVGLEALARLRDHRNRSIPPNVFIPVAEECGLIAELGRHVLRTACADLAGWRALSPATAHLGVSVNISAHHADSADLVSDVRQALHRAGLPPQALTVELTETVTVLLEHPVVAALRQLRAVGVRVALDDFGTGYAALSHLLRLPVTELKIDRSFTAGLPLDPVSTAIVSAVVGLADDLGLSCVVEGIETDIQLHALTHGLSRWSGSLIGQGYLLGRPVPAHDVPALLAIPHPARVELRTGT